MVVAITALVVAVAGAAVAAIPNPDGSVAACYRNATGKLKVIDTGVGESCKQRETALSLAAMSGGKVAELRQARRAGFDCFPEREHGGWR